MRTNKTFEKPAFEILAVKTGHEIAGSTFKESRHREQIYKTENGYFLADLKTTLVTCMIRRGSRRFEYKFLLNAKTQHGRCDVFHSCFDGELPDALKQYSAKAGNRPLLCFSPFASRFMNRM